MIQPARAGVTNHSPTLSLFAEVSEDSPPSSTMPSTSSAATSSNLFQWQPSLGRDKDEIFSALHATFNSPWPLELNAAISQGSQKVTVAAFDLDGTLIKPRLSPDGSQRTVR